MFFTKINENSEEKTESTNKPSPMPKPDFSCIEKYESSFGRKEKGSYKKTKLYVPESPMKSPNSRYFTPNKAGTSNLLGSSCTAKKLNFGGETDIYKDKHLIIEETDDDYFESRKGSKNKDLFSKKRNLNNIFMSNDSTNLRDELTQRDDFDEESIFETKYHTLRKINNGEFGIVLKCKKNDDGQIYAIKKSKKPIKYIMIKI